MATSQSVRWSFGGRLCLALFLVTALNFSGAAWGARPSPSPGKEPLAVGGEEGPGASDPSSPGKLKQAWALYQAGKYGEALVLAGEAVEFRRRTYGPEDLRTAKALHILGIIQLAGFKFRGAVSSLQQALAIREKTLGPDHPVTADSLLAMGRAYVLVASYAQAEPLLMRALLIRKKALGPEHPKTADVMVILARLHRETGNHARAQTLGLEALAIKEKAYGVEHPDNVACLELLTLIYQQQGALDKARPLAERAVKILRKELGPEHPRTLQAHRVLSTVHQAGGELSQAETESQQGVRGRTGSWSLAGVQLSQGRYEEALKILMAAPPSRYAPEPRLAQYQAYLGQALQGLGRRQEAAEAYLRAVEAIEDLRARTPGERTSFFQAGLISGYYTTYLALTSLLADMGQKGEALPDKLRSYGDNAAAAAFYFAESIKARALLEAIAAKAGKDHSQQLPPDLADKERKLQEQAKALEAKREEVYLPHRGMLQDVEAFELHWAKFKRSQQEFVEELRRRLPRHAALYYPRPYKTAELPLKSGEILLAYTLGDKESYLFRVEPGGKTQVFRLPLGRKALESRIGPLLSPLRQSELRRQDLSRFSIQAAAALYRELLEPGLAGVSPGQRLIIVPDGVLGAFPFEALVVQSGPDWGKALLVGDRWPVTYSQSAAILALNRHLGLARAGQPLFALGDCIYDAGSARYKAYKAGQGQAGELRPADNEKPLTMSVTGPGGGRLVFAPLPETRKTVAELASLFGVAVKAPQILLDVQANETQVRKAPLSQYRYLFFGTHGFLTDKLANLKEPVLVLSQVDNTAPDNGFLTFSKVLQLKLDADLVTLAACMTGMGEVVQGEGVLNFARAFQQAGARSVTVTLWNIPVDESLKFYRTLYEGLKAGKSKLQALQGARQAIRATEPHPFFWAGIILHGEG